MPRRYAKKLHLAKLNASLELSTSKQELNNTTETNEESLDNLAEASGSDSEDESPNTSRQKDEPLRYLLENTAHYTHPLLNQGLGQSSVPERTFELYPRCSLTVPLPLFVANQPTPIVEPCTRRPINYEVYMRQLKMCKAKYLKQTATQKHRELKHKDRVYNFHLFDAAEHIATQDNAYFRDSYDYYYTGGNLNFLQFGAGGSSSKTLGVHVSGKQLQQLHISEVGTEAELWRPLHTESLSGMSSEIFELQPVQSFRVNHGNMFLARLLNELAIYELRKSDIDAAEEEDEHTEYQLCCQSKFSSQEGPFISAAQAVNQPMTLAFACQDRSVRFRDMVTQADISRHEVSMLKGVHKDSTWAQLLAAQEHCFYYACQSVLLTVDMRCANEVISPCFASSVHSSHCESFSCLARSRNPQLFYVASNHKLHCLDMRCLGKKLTDRAVVSWTHQMSYPPTFMDTLAHEGSEYIALGSAVPTDQRICELKGVLAQDITAMSSASLPYAPPQLDEALSEARLQGHNVSIYSDLTERIKCCNTGLKFQRLDGACDGAFAQLLMANSVGDITCQRVTLRDSLEMQQEQRTGLHTSEAILYYADVVHQRVQKKLQCTEVQHMSVLRKLMKTDAERNLPAEEAQIEDDISIDYGLSDSETESNPESVEDQTQSQPKESQESATAEVSAEVPTPVEVPATSTVPDPLPIPAPAAVPASEPFPNPAKVESLPDSPTKQEKLKKLRSVNRGPWQKSAYYLSRFSDVISKRLLNIWDIDEFELTRDVSSQMVDEKLKHEKDNLDSKHRIAEWLQEMPDKTREEEDNSTVVPGTTLRKLYEAKNAEYREIRNESIYPDVSAVKLEANDSTELSGRRPSLLEPNQFTIIESELDANPRPTKRAKTKYTMGF